MGQKLHSWIQAPKKVQVSKIKLKSTQEINGHVFSIMEETCACVQNISGNYQARIRPMNAAKTTQGEPLYSLLSDTEK